MRTFVSVSSSHSFPSNIFYENTLPNHHITVCILNSRRTLLNSCKNLHLIFEDIQYLAV
jgi:hypothetical protein